MLRSRLLWQIWALFGLTLMISSLMLGVFVANQIENDQLSRIEQTLYTQTQALLPTMNPILDEGATLSDSELTGLAPGTLARITLISSNGKVLADNRMQSRQMDNHGDRPEILTASEEVVGVARRFSSTLDQSMLYLAVRFETDLGASGFLRLALPTTEIDEQMARLYRQLMLSAVIIGVLFLLIGYFLAYRITRPMSEMTAVAREIAGGRFSLRLPDQRQDEVGQLASVVNELASEAEIRIEEVTRHRNQLASVLAGLTEGVLALDSELRVLHINQTAIQMLNLGNNTVIGRTIEELHLNPEIRQVVDITLTTGSGTTATLSQDGLMLECTGGPIQSTMHDGDSGVLIVLEDVTERHRLEKVRSDFVANASHELKTPISAIRGMVETIIDDPDMSAEVTNRFTDRIRHQSIRLELIVQDLLELSRFDAFATQPSEEIVDLDVLMNRVYQDKLYDAQDAGVNLQLELKSTDLQVRGDAEAISQLITNLVDNAIKYSGESGVVQLTLDKAGSTARLEVKDNGIGIAPDDRLRIFERFYRVDQARSRDLGGTGLGLAIVKHIAQAHHGSVKVESQLGIGSTFCVDLPLASKN